MKSEKANVIIFAFFCAIILFGAVAGVLLPDKYYSESEKRKLTQFPQISIQNFISGKTGKDIESYFADQFPARDGWITVKTLTELASGKHDVGGVYFCNGGYLIEKQTSYNKKQYQTNLDALKALSDNLAKSGVAIKIMLVPTAPEILSYKLPASAPHINQDAMLRQAKDMGLNIVDTTKILAQHNSEYIYYKTDHHYTSLGAYYCYCAWKESKDEIPEPLSAWKLETLCNNFRGTTYAKVNYVFAAFDTITAYYKTKKHTVNYNDGNYITDSIYERKYLEGKDQYAAFFNSNQSTTVISGESRGKLLILKDSYANTFAQFLIDEYEETHMIDMRFYKKSVENYIADNGITEVLVLYNLPGFAADMGIMKLACATSAQQ